MRTLTRIGAGVLAISMALGVAACGDDSDDKKDDAADTTDESTTTTKADTPAGETVTVTAVDYAYQDLPESIAAGTVLKLVNQSAGEAHELVAVKIPDAEKRSVSDLLNLSDEELGKAFGGEPDPATVLLAPPSSTEQIPAVGDGTISEPGRYVVACFIPVGADPSVVLNPEGDGPPESDAPPHFTKGMYAELIVT
jgi:hypothetical protein